MLEDNYRIDSHLSAFDYRFHITRVCLVTVVMILLFCLVGCQSKIQYPLSKPNANIAKIVASAAPATSMPNTATNKRSNTILITQEIKRKRREEIKI